jgi:transposase-like protein
MGRQDNPFASLVSSLDDDGFELLQDAISERRCRARIGFGTFEEAAALYRPEPACPSCGCGSATRDGRTPAGRQRYQCPLCGKRFSMLTNTVLEYGKKNLATWVDFITLMCYNAPLDLAVEMCGVAHSTAFEWRHRVFATVDGYQDRLKLSGRIWIDELYLTDSSLERVADWKPKRGLSKDKLCIAVAIDARKNVVVVVCGHGKPSTKRIKDALLDHIEQRSVIVHDKERAHNGLVEAAKCTDDAYKADANNPVYLESMAMVNNLCSWLRRYLFRFPGMKMVNLQSYLNWFVYLFRVKRDNGRWPRIARVIRHLLMSEASYRSS